MRPYTEARPPAGGSADPGSGKGADGAHSDHADAEDGRVRAALQISERERNLSVSGERDRVQEHLSESGLSDIRR